MIDGEEAAGRGTPGDRNSQDATSSNIDEAEGEVVYMALLYDQGQLGVAVYDATNARLRTLQLAVGSQSELVEVVERLHTQFDVHRVVVSARNASTHGILQMLKNLNAKLDRDTAVTIRKFITSSQYSEALCNKLELLVSEFTYVRACQSIEHVRIGEMWWDNTTLNHEMTRREIYKFLGSYFDFESKALIRASGALLAYLASEKIGNQLERSTAVCLSVVERATLEGIMHVDNGTFQSLQIFSRESHPSLVKGSGRAKEGFSLFGLLNRTVTKAGSTLLRQWMLAPLVGVEEINKRLDAVGFLTSADNEDLLQAMRAKLRRFGDVSRIFSRIRARCASALEWSKLNDSISSFMVIQGLLQKVCAERPDVSLPVLIAGAVGESSMIHLSNLLGNIIDFEESLQEESIVIRTGVSDVLDAARSKYEDLDNVLTEVAYQIQEAHSSLSSITVQYIPQVGYVICCNAPTTLSDFVFQFQEDDATFYYKDACCRDLDASVGDVFGFILDLQRELLEELTVAAMQYEHCIFDMITVVARLDGLASLADVARNFNYSRPIISDRNEFIVQHARHPLQELIVDHFIPNDITLDTSKTTMLITGQNGSGKSVYLKMTGLLQFMAQIGSFVPAEKATIGTVSKILTRIHSMETASVSQSSFTIDCNQISWMLKEKNSRALFLIDEFGKGTAEADGTALLAATIKHFTRQRTNPAHPRVVITTHLLDVFRKNLLSTNSPGTQTSEPSTDTDLGDESSAVVCAMMASAESSDRSEPVPMFSPLHELRQGVTLSSNALGCAVTCGIPSEIVKRASEIIALRKSGQRITSRVNVASGGPSWEDALLAHFVSVDNWSQTPDESLSTFRAMIRMDGLVANSTRSV